jgi:hypothetical protein
LQTNGQADGAFFGNAQKDWQVFEGQTQIGVAVRLAIRAGGSGDSLGRELGRVQAVEKVVIWWYYLFG